MSKKNPIDPIGNRTRDLPSCSAEPQQTAPTAPRISHGTYGKVQEIRNCVASAIQYIQSIQNNFIYLSIINMFRPIRPSEGRCVQLTTLPSSCDDCLEVWERQPPGTL